jgi:putative membrane protein
MVGYPLLVGVAPFSATNLLSESTFDPVPAVLSAAALWAYLAGVRRLAARGRQWPVRRTASFVVGIVSMVIATQSGLAAYDTVLFSAHVAQHVLLGIVAPAFLALSAPVTLALQATTRPTQVNLLRVLRSRPAGVVGHPLVAWLVFGSTLFVLYFSPLYEWSLRNDVVHAWVHLHFVVAGSLFCWATIGLDPVPHRLGYGPRLLLVLMTVPFHAFLGLALLTMHDPIAATYYADQARTWGASALDDQRIGAAIMWIVGDVMSVTLSVVILQQWWQAEQRQTRRLDARLDAQLEAARGQHSGSEAEVDVAIVTGGSISRRRVTGTR